MPRHLIRYEYDRPPKAGVRLYKKFHSITFVVLKKLNKLYNINFLLRSIGEKLWAKNGQFLDS